MKDQETGAISKGRETAPKNLPVRELPTSLPVPANPYRQQGPAQVARKPVPQVKRSAAKTDVSHYGMSAEEDYESCRKEAKRQGITIPGITDY